MKTKELIDEAISLPLEERAMLADALLQSLNQKNEAIDKMWAAEAKRRLDELHSGKITGIDGAAVFERIWKRFEG